MLGGVLLALAAVLHSLEPSGCIGLECETRAMRTATGVVSVLAPVAAGLILIGLAGLALIARQSGRHSKLALTGLICAAAGMSALLLGGLIQTIFYGGDSPWMPFFVVPGILFVIVGVVLLAIFILLARVLPRWLGALLAVSGVLLLGANEQTIAVLLAVPFGLVMATVGLFMWSSGRREHAIAAAPR